MEARLRRAGNPNVSMVGMPKVSPSHHALIGEMLGTIYGTCGARLGTRDR